MSTNSIVLLPMGRVLPCDLCKVTNPAKVALRCVKLLQSKRDLHRTLRHRLSGAISHPYDGIPGAECTMRRPRIRGPSKTQDLLILASVPGRFLAVVHSLARWLQKLCTRLLMGFAHFQSSIDACRNRAPTEKSIPGKDNTNPSLEHRLNQIPLPGRGTKIIVCGFALGVYTRRRSIQISSFDGVQIIGLQAAAGANYLPLSMPRRYQPYGMCFYVLPIARSRSVGGLYIPSDTSETTCTLLVQPPTMVLAASFVASLILLTVAKPMGRRTMSVHESRAEPARGFVKSSVAPAEKELTLRIALKQTDITGLETMLYQVSDPASAQYGQHLTPDEVATFVKPTDDTLAAVTEWLAENSIAAKPVTPAGDMLEITIPVSQANDLLAADFSVFTHVESGTTSIRTLQYSIPASLQGHIDFFHPTLSFTRPIGSIPKFKAVRAKPEVVEDAAPVSDAVPASCDSIITPACLQALYNIPTTVATEPSNTLGVAGFILEWANLLDLKQFLTAFRTDIPSTTNFTLQTLDGGVNTQTRSQAGVEANLDIQYTVGVATGVPVTFISVGENGSDGLDGFLDIITTLINETDRPNVLTTSYGFDESDLTLPVANTLCNAYMQLGALGTTLIFSSGDGGVSGSQSQSCTTFIPTLPSDCPFVTSIGSVGGITEVASTFSSGGFSNYFPIPDYQAADVAAYVATLGTTYAGKYNASGRGFPDVAVQGENFEIAWDASTGTVDGTSCSAPSFASIISLLNDQLIAAGKSPLGFLNPFLYSDAGRAAFKDVTSGTNPGCSTNGFSAGSGWDPVTGLGTPDFALLKTAVGL